MNKQSGFSIIQAVVGIAILTTMSLQFATLMSNASTQEANLKTSLDIVDIRISVNSILSNQDICTAQLGGKLLPFDGAGQPVANGFLPIPELRAGTAPTAPLIFKVNSPTPATNSSGLKIASAQIQNIQATGSSGSYVGVIHIEFDTGKNMARAPIEINLNLLSTTAAPYSIVSCSSGNLDRGPASINLPEPSTEFNLSEKNRGNCDGAPVSNTGIPILTPETQTSLCSTIQYPVPADGTITCAKTLPYPPSAGGPLDILSSNFGIRNSTQPVNNGNPNEVFGMIGRYFPCADSSKGIANPKSKFLAGMKSQEECMKLSRFPEGSNLEKLPGEGSATPVSCINGRWVAK